MVIHISTALLQEHRLLQQTINTPQAAMLGPSLAVPEAIRQSTGIALNALRMTIGPIIPIALIAAGTAAGIYTILKGKLPPQIARPLGLLTGTKAA